MGADPPEGVSFRHGEDFLTSEDYRTPAPPEPFQYLNKPGPTEPEGAGKTARLSSSPETSRHWLWQASLSASRCSFRAGFCTGSSVLEAFTG